MKLPFGFVPTSRKNQDRARLIKPDHIRLSPTTLRCGSFDKEEVEEAAGKLVSLLKLMVYWKPFDTDFVRVHYHRQGWDEDRIFFGLSGPWLDDPMGGVWREASYVQLLPNGKCAVTDVFILRCMGIEANFPTRQYS